MKKVKLEQGLGYIKDKDGNIIEKFDLKPGEHPFPGGTIIVEVATRQELDAIEIWEDPAIKEEYLIQDEIDKQKMIDAIKSLKAKGKLREDYKEE